MAKKKRKLKTKTLKKPVRKKPCPMCTSGASELDYKDVNSVRRYVNEKSKIAARRVSGACARHQRAVQNAVKRARQMALIPYCTSR